MDALAAERSESARGLALCVTDALALAVVFATTLMVVSGIVEGISWLVWG